MKTWKHLYTDFCSYENLYHAFRKARKGKRQRSAVAAFEQNLENELWLLHQPLVTQQYRPGRYRHFTIYEAKPRRISAAPFRDRVVHHALCNVLEPIWEPRFIHDSYACRVGKGSHAALDRAQSFMRRYRYVLQCDIVQFFPSIDHQVLYTLLANKVADKPLRRLIWQLIKSGRGIHDHRYQMVWFEGDDLLSQCRPRGLPIGNQTSQFWSNVYLNELDQFVKRELHCPAYLRYCDDFLLFSNDKQQLHDWHQRLNRKLADLRLIVHPHRTSVHPVERGTPFLGLTLYPQRRRLARSNVIRFRRRFKVGINDLATGKQSREQLDALVNGWVAHAAHADSWQLRRSILCSTCLPVGNHASEQANETIPRFYKDPPFL